MPAIVDQTGSDPDIVGPFAGALVSTRYFAHDVHALVAVGSGA